MPLTRMVIGTMMKVVSHGESSPEADSSEEIRDSMCRQRYEEHAILALLACLITAVIVFCREAGNLLLRPVEMAEANREKSKWCYAMAGLIVLLAIGAVVIQLR